MRRVLLVVVLALLRPRASPERDASRQDDRCAVAHVVDGDTFRGGDDRKVRLIGVDTPEQGQGEAGRLARQALLAFLPLGGPYTVPPDVKYAERIRLPPPRLSPQPVPHPIVIGFTIPCMRWGLPSLLSGRKQSRT
jgi:hypothetical protein